MILLTISLIANVVLLVALWYADQRMNVLYKEADKDQVLISILGKK